MAATPWRRSPTAPATPQTTRRRRSRPGRRVQYLRRRLTSASNTVTSALSGVTLTCSTRPRPRAAPSTARRVWPTIPRPFSATSAPSSRPTTPWPARSRAGGFDASTGTAGPMMGDSLLTGIQNQIQMALYSIVNTGQHLQLAGQHRHHDQSDGTLSLEHATLPTALGTNFRPQSAVQRRGRRRQHSSTRSSPRRCAPQGSISRQPDADHAGKRADQAERPARPQMAALTASLTQQYSALNTLLSSLQTTSSYLTQAFASLPKIAVAGRLTAKRRAA